MVTIKLVKCKGSVLTEFLSALVRIGAKISTEFTYAEQNKVTVNIGMSNIHSIEVTKRSCENAYQIYLYGYKNEKEPNIPNLESFEISFEDIDYMII